MTLLSRPEKGVFPIIINFSLLPLGILAYYFEEAELAIGGAVACILFFFSYLFYKNIEFLSVAPTLFAFGLTPLVFALLKGAAKNKGASFAEEVGRLQEELAAIREGGAGLKGELDRLDEEVSQTAGLYEITKEMSSTLLFGEIFQILSGFLKKNFRFISCKLILLAQDKEANPIEKVYRIEAGPTDVGAAELVDIEIVKEVFKSRKLIYWQDFIAIPLISQDRIIGVLNVEGLEAAALERFLIVARQFSLEIEHVRLYETIQSLAITDGLTGVFVRRYFMERFKEELERSARHRLTMSFLIIDLDHFKEFNDRFGHLVGDLLLREAAKVLKQHIREIDLLGRYGGEEFLLLLPETDKKGALLVAERLRLEVGDKTFKAYDEAHKITISLGVSTFPEDASRITELMDAADKALYLAKEQGRNRVVAFTRG